MATHNRGDSRLGPNLRSLLERREDFCVGGFVGASGVDESLPPSADQLLVSFHHVDDVQEIELKMNPAGHGTFRFLSFRLASRSCLSL